MKTSQKKLFMVLAVVFCYVIIYSCSSDDDSSSDNNTEELVGQDGNPRFNLTFTNEQNVDLDLYVKTPSGSVISYANTTADGGELDVDCLCFGCAQGPTENIFWQDGTAPSGQYEYWVDYFGSCSGSSASSDFTLRVIRNGTVLETRTGTLSNGQSTTWIHNQ